MLRYIYANQLGQFPRLRDEMFTHRAEQFRTRLGWDVSVDAQGHERDEYDDLNPLYIIWETADGGHGGSSRFLPTTGPVMVNDHFSHLLSGPIRSPLIWECTRFCMAPGQGPNVAAALMLGGGELMNAAILWVCSMRAWCGSTAAWARLPRCWAPWVKDARRSAWVCGNSMPRRKGGLPPAQVFYLRAVVRGLNAPSALNLLWNLPSAPERHWSPSGHGLNVGP